MVVLKVSQSLSGAGPLALLALRLAPPGAARPAAAQAAAPAAPRAAARPPPSGWNAPVSGAEVGSGRIVASEIEAPNMIVNLV